MPRPLLEQLRNVPRAVGVYAAVARIYRATRAPVPLSPADLCRYDPTLSTGSADRALRRLVETGYLLVGPSEGRRNAYRPTWGRIKGESRPWELEAPALGRPRHVATAQLPQNLLDHYLGRLEPHAQRGAHVTRYITQPLLTLADVGSYALLLAGYPADTSGLEALNLVAEGQALPLPSVEDTLALVTQRRLFDAGSPVALTQAGWSRLGLTPPQPAPAPGRPLIFMPAPIGAHPANPLGQLIGSPPQPARPPSASQRPRGRMVPAAPGSHGSSCEKGLQNHPQPPTEQQANGGGGHASLPSRRPERPAAPPAGTTVQTTAPEESPAMRRLREFGVRRDVAATLADRPLAQIERVIGLGRRHPGVRDIAAWVVGVLRALPADEPESAPPPRKVSDKAILLHPALSNAERVRWLMRFRNAEPADKPVILSRFLQEHPLDTVG